LEGFEENLALFSSSNKKVIADSEIVSLESAVQGEAIKSAIDLLRSHRGYQMKLLENQQHRQRKEVRPTLMISFLLIEFYLI
jgi:hypothetical protein